MDRETFNRIFGSHYVVQTPSELFWLVNLVEALNLHTIIEIGIEMGGTWKFWEQLVKPGDLVVGVDINPLTPQQITWSWQNSDRKMVLITGDSIDPETVRLVREALSGRLVDFLFIDGNHDWEHVSGDFQNYSEFVGKGGLVGFHDIEAGDCKRFFDSLPGRKEKNPPCREVIGTGVWWKS